MERVSPYRKVSLSLLALTVAFAGLTACSKDPGPGPSVDLFLKGWSTGDFGSVTMIRSNGEIVANNVVAEELAALSGSLKDTKPTLAKGKIDTKDDRSTVEIKVSQPIPGGKWDYATAVTSHKVQDAWQLVWEPKVVHPQLNLGDRLETRRVSQTRGGVLAANGEELVKLRSVVTIGIWPSKIIGSKDKLVTDLANALKPVADMKAADIHDLPAADIEAGVLTQVITSPGFGSHG
jgi:hypothetical protein